ncbi:MAG: hypothetical protein OXT67_02760 [Zetaproteobacteria bacterium]|nr:hypothetical protein [Zetaproteobacteria bacterium]
MAFQLQVPPILQSLYSKSQLSRLQPPFKPRLAQFNTANYPHKAHVASNAAAKLPTSHTFNMQHIQVKDLSIVLDTLLKQRISIHEPGLFEVNWLLQVDEAFQTTAVKNAFLTESPPEDWQLISARISPCFPMVNSRAFNAQIFCWPQVRTVWQPVISSYAAEWTHLHNYSDDRAIHTLYWTLPTMFGDTSTHHTDEAFFNHILHLATQQPEALSQLSPQTLQRWVTLRNQMAKQILKKTHNLRGTLQQRLFHGFGIRPELFKPNEQGIFRDKFIRFLQTYAAPQNLYEMTSFSLTGGRVPALMDIWVFLAFSAERGHLVRKPLHIYDSDTGQPLNQAMMSQSITTGEDDTKFYNHPNHDKLRQQVLLYENDFKSISKRIFAKEPLLVGETSCATCHRFNAVRFNFHNQSKFNELETTISGKLKNEVAQDIQWIRRELLETKIN